MTLRERLSKKIQEGEREETIVVEGITLTFRASDDTEFFAKTLAMMSDTEESEMVAKEWSAKLKTLFGITSGVKPEEVWKIRLIAQTAREEGQKPFDPVEVCAIYRRDHIMYLSMLAAAIKVSGLNNTTAILEGNSPASTGGSSSSSAASSGQPGKPHPSSNGRAGRNRKSETQPV